MVVVIHAGETAVTAAAAEGAGLARGRVVVAAVAREGEWVEGVSAAWAAAGGLWVVGWESGGGGLVVDGGVDIDSGGGSCVIHLET